MSTLQAWATPLTLGLPPNPISEYADHTFVYCPENKQIFGCWATGNSIDAEDTEMVVERNQSNAYAIADCYRGSYSVPDTGITFPDTANVGVYGINGVCMQSANLFLYAAGTVMPLDRSRPRAYALTVAAYGFTGAPFPFAEKEVPGSNKAYFDAWWLINYYWCSGKKDSLMATSEDPLFLEVYAKDRRTNDLAVLIEHAVPEMEVDLEAVLKIQQSYLREHDAVLRTALADIPELRVIDNVSAESVDTLSAQFQKELAALIGADTYLALTGFAADKTVKLIDPRIMESARNAAQRR